MVAAFTVVAAASLGAVLAVSATITRLKQLLPFYANASRRLNLCTFVVALHSAFVKAAHSSLGQPALALQMVS